MNLHRHIFPHCQQYETRFFKQVYVDADSKIGQLAIGTLGLVMAKTFASPEWRKKIRPEQVGRAGRGKARRTHPVKEKIKKIYKNNFIFR